MTFATDANQATIGRVIRVDISFDKFATITHRFGTAAGLLDGVNQYSSRILSMGNMSRGFGESRVAASGNTSIVLDNADGALDSLVGRDNIANHSKLRARIYVCLFDPAAAGSLTTKQLGEFSLQAWPRRDNSTITLDLADDVIGSVSQLSPLPSIYDWFQVGTAANNPIKGGFGLPDVLDSNNAALSERGAAQIQLAFGEDWVLAMPHILPADNFASIDAKYQNKVIVPVCCTTDVSDGFAYEISELCIYYSDSVASGGSSGPAGPPRMINVPRSYATLGGEPPIPIEIWRTERSPVITKNGKSYRIVYLVVAADLGLPGLQGYRSWLYGDQLFNNSTEIEPAQALRTYENAGNERNGGYPLTDVRRMRDYANHNPQIAQYATVVSGVYQWWVKGAPLSARSFPGPVQHPCDVLADLVLYYSNATSPTVDPVSQYRVKTSNATAACAGVIQPWTDRANRDSITGFNAPPSLRQVMTKLCQSSDIDIFINWLGQFAFSGDQRDYETALYQTGNVLPDFPENQLSGMEEWLPSDGERYSIFNRLFLAGGRTLPPEGKDVPFAGPWDFGGVGPLGLSLTDRVVENTLEIGWRPYRQQALNPINNRQLDVVARTKVKFRVGLRGLTLDLGDYFTLTWTRNLGGPYLKTAFKVESLSYAPADDEVEIEGIWRDDVITERVYLLDDESFRIRSKNVGGGTAKAYPVGASDTCTFDAGLDLSAMGVQAGDMLVLLDASEPLNEFNANQVFRINNVLSATALTVAGGGFWDPMPSPQIEPTEWQIYRGATTDPTSVTDPVLYPDGASMFGKVTDASGNYSNTAQGNRLING